LAGNAPRPKALRAKNFWGYRRRRGDLLLSLLQTCADLEIQSDIRIPSIHECITLYVLQLHPANVRALSVNRAEFALHVIVPARIITPIEKLRFSGEMYMLTTQSTLLAGKVRHVSNRMIHMYKYRGDNYIDAVAASYMWIGGTGVPKVA